MLSRLEIGSLPANCLFRSTCLSAYDVGDFDGKFWCFVLFRPDNSSADPALWAVRYAEPPGFRLAPGTNSRTYTVVPPVSFLISLFPYIIWLPVSQPLGCGMVASPPSLDYVCTPSYYVFSFRYSNSCTIFGITEPSRKDHIAVTLQFCAVPRDSLARYAVNLVTIFHRSV